MPGHCLEFEIEFQRSNLCKSNHISCDGIRSRSVNLLSILLSLVINKRSFGEKFLRVIDIPDGRQTEFLRGRS